MPCRDAEASVEWVASNEALAAAVATWTDIIGLDTEFQRTNTFYPIPGLYQVISGGRVFLLDPLAIDEWAPFVRVLEDPRVVLIMHACGEDLELLRHHLGAVPQGIFDTQLAHAFVSTEFSMSYANLVSSVLAQELAKHETRSDWLQRPLTSRQVHYAWEDVVHLPLLHEVLGNALRDLGRGDWFEETMRVRGRYERGDPDEYYRSVRKAWRLTGAELAVLKVLIAWRERRAMQEDVPRKRVVWDEHLYNFARTPELEESHVWQLLPKPVARKYASTIVALHSEGQATAAPKSLDQPLTRAQGEIGKVMREAARSQARALDFAEELLARKRDIEECVRHFLDTGELSGAYAGWREPLVGEEFRSILGRLK
jgi:ribonuclease D